MKLLALLLAGLIFQPGPKLLREEAPRRTDGWLGLHCNGTCALRAAVLEYRTFPAEPGRLDAESRPREAHYLFREVPGLTVGPVERAAYEATGLAPQSKLKILLGGETYELRVDAALTVTLHRRGTWQTIHRMPEFVDDAHVSLHFAGDLDRDGKLDLIMTNSWKYSYAPVQLYLSSAARDGELVREVAKLDRYAC